MIEYKVGDSVVRLFNNKVYTIAKIEKCGSILIVRHPTPTKPHFTWVSRWDIVLTSAVKP